MVTARINGAWEDGNTWFTPETTMGRTRFILALKERVPPNTPLFISGSVRLKNGGTPLTICGVREDIESAFAVIANIGGRTSVSENANGDFCLSGNTSDGKLSARIRIMTKEGLEAYRALCEKDPDMKKDSLIRRMNNEKYTQRLGIFAHEREVLVRATNAQLAGLAKIGEEILAEKRKEKLDAMNATAAIQQTVQTPIT